jgi:hypothetical protein
MAVHQCPFCPLRFGFRPEMRWHVDYEHRRVHVEERKAESDDTVPPATDNIRCGVQAMPSRSRSRASLVNGTTDLMQSQVARQ